MVDTNQHPQRVIKALVVEDDPASMNYLLFLLKKWHISAIPAFSGEEALEKISNEAIDILFLDINLGDSMSGIDLLTLLRLQDAFITVPAIAVTAYHRDKNLLIGAGFNALLTKPYNSKMLINILNKYLPDRDKIKNETDN